MKPSELRRHQQRGSYDLESVSSVFDDTFMAHVSYVDKGSPQCLPMIALFYKIGGVTSVYLHGHPSARLMELVRQNPHEDGTEKKEKIKVCITATKGKIQNSAYASWRVLLIEYQWMVWSFPQHQMATPSTIDVP